MQISMFCCYLQSFLCKIWGHGIFWWHQRAICDSVLHKNRIFHQLTKVFSQKFPPQTCTMVFKFYYSSWINYCIMVSAHTKGKNNHYPVNMSKSSFLVKKKKERCTKKKIQMSGVGFEPTPTIVDCDLNAAP